MKLEIELNGAPHAVEVSRSGKPFQALIDGEPIGADAVEIAPGIYSILIGNRSFEVRVERFGADLRIAVGRLEYVARVRDPRRWERNHNSSAVSGGRQNVVAPMSGRVVRVLAKIGDTINAGQGIVVVEAMKMQNEIRSPKTGKIESLKVSEDQAVNAGETIAVVS
jgi:biotin carboxyl carrier protein